MNERINAVIQHTIRPALQDHYGDIELADYQSGVVSVRLTGACQGCPSARDTLEGLVLKAVQAAIPEVKEVVLVSDISEDLLDVARRLLRKEASGERPCC